MSRKKGPPARRIELSGLKEGDPVLAELDQEAAALGLSLAEHICTLLRRRYAARSNGQCPDPLWIPGIAAAMAPQASTPPPAPAAADAAELWANMID